MQELPKPEQRASAKGAAISPKAAKAAKSPKAKGKAPGKQPEHEPQSQGLAAAKDPGKTGGKVTWDDFAYDEGVSHKDIERAGADVEAMNKMSLEEMQAYVGKPSKPIQARSTKDMLAAIQSKVMPRWVARVSPTQSFARGHFGYAGANQIFATEPCDVIGLSPAEALIKVGWTVAQLQKQVGQDISVCVLDTSKVVERCVSSGDAEKGEEVTQTTVQGQPDIDEMNWDTLEAVAMDSTKNGWFHHQLTKYAYIDPETQLVTFIKAEELPELFALAKQTPVGGVPDADPVMQAKYATFRQVMGEGLSASELFSGMGATVSEKGQLGCREVMVKNEQSHFALTPENHVLTSIGTLEQAELDQLL